MHNEVLEAKHAICHNARSKRRRFNISAKSSTRGAVTHARLRKVAASVFAKRGYHDTKVSDIVEAAGVSQPTFYSYFESKEAAYDELVQEFRLRLKNITGSLLIKEIKPASAFVDRMALSFFTFLDFLAEDLDLTEIGFFQPPGSSITKDQMSHWVAANIVEEQKGAFFRADIPADRIGRCLIGIVDQMARLRTTQEERRVIAQDCARIFCEGAWAPQPS